MELRRLIDGLFLGLVLSAALVPSSNVVGESLVTPQTRTGALLAIVEQANATVAEIFSDLRTRGLLIPPAALDLYDDGRGAAAEAFRLYDLGRYEEARSTAVEALQKFKAALDVAYTEVQDPATQIPSATELVRRLNHSITRGFQHLKAVENLAHILKAHGYDTTFLEIQIQAARGLLHKALGELRRHRFMLVDSTLELVRELLEALRARLAAIAAQLKVSQLVTFIGAVETRLTRLRGTILSLSSELSPEATNASLAAVEDAEQSLDQARSLLEGQQVNAAINELVQSKASEEEAWRILRESQPVTGSVTSTGPRSAIPKSDP